MPPAAAALPQPRPPPRPGSAKMQSARAPGGGQAVQPSNRAIPLPRPLSKRASHCQPQFEPTSKRHCKVHGDVDGLAQQKAERLRHAGSACLSQAHDHQPSCLLPISMVHNGDPVPISAGSAAATRPAQQSPHATVPVTGPQCCHHCQTRHCRWLHWPPELTTVSNVICCMQLLWSYSSATRDIHVPITSACRQDALLRGELDDRWSEHGHKSTGCKTMLMYGPAEEVSQHSD